MFQSQTSFGLAPPLAASRRPSGEKLACAKMVPGGQLVDLRVNTSVANVDAELAYAPLYAVTYRYEGAEFRALINGVTGNAKGQAPLSMPRMLLAAGAVVAIPLAIAWFFRRRRG